MAPRLDLQVLLESILGSDNVYYQPPTSLRMRFPAIVYQREDIWTIHADNKPYRQKMCYQVTVIDRNPDSDIPLKIAELPLCSYSTHFVTDNINHDVFRLYF